MVCCAKVLITLLLIETALPSCWARPKSFIQKRTMFNIKLSKAANGLLNEVEKLYGKKVREEEVQNWEPVRYGESAIDVDGTPVVRINAGTGRSEENIVHELFHLKLYTRGFPLVGYNPPAESRTRENFNYLQLVSNYLFDPIQHAIFYPELAKLGFKPNAQTEKADRKLHRSR